MIAGLRRRKQDVGTILCDVMEDYADAFAQMEDTYAQQRGADVRDLASRVLRNVRGHPTPPRDDAMVKPSILVAHELLPSVAGTLDKARILGIVTDLGGYTSHAAIMARALEIPAVVGLEDISQTVEWGDTLLIDGTRGRVVLNPSAQERVQYGHLEHACEDMRERLKALKGEPAQTKDGLRIQLRANIELADRAGSALEVGADGIGLFRTEYLFLSRPDLPDEDEQVAAYETVAQAVHPAPVVIRTLDAGGEKLLSHLHMEVQSADPLGCRGIRLCLARPDVFHVQLRAILRAARLGNVRLMYPMVSGADEVRQANAMLRKAADELRAEGGVFNAHPEIGAMIEAPSAALTVDLIAPHVGFVSLGTNDLVQYTIAVNRLDRRTAALYEPAHPGVLRLMKQAIDLAAASKIRLAVCGEMAGNPLLAPLLIGMGIEELSVAPGSVLLIKHIIRSIHRSDAAALAETALNATTADEVMASCRKLVERDAHDVKDLFA